MIRSILAKSSVQSFLALAFSAVACYLAIVGRISGEAFLAIVGVVVAFYFKTTQTSG